MADWFQTFFGKCYEHVLPRTWDEARTLDQARDIRRALRLRKGQHVLDIPCGMGRLTIPLAKRQLVMTGVDLTAQYLKRARRLAKKEGLDVSFLHSDMRDIAFREEFDAAFNWFGSFGYFSDQENLAFARRVLDALKPGGRFLVEGINKSWMLAHFKPTHQQTIGKVHIAIRNRFDPGTGRVVGCWVFRKGRLVERKRTDIRIYNGADLRALLKQAGFREIELYGRPPLGRFTRHSRRIIAVGRKPGRRRRSLEKNP